MLSSTNLGAKHPKYIKPKLDTKTYLEHKLDENRPNLHVKSSEHLKPIDGGASRIVESKPAQDLKNSVRNKKKPQENELKEIFERIKLKKKEKEDRKEKEKNKEIETFEKKEKKTDMGEK